MQTRSFNEYSLDGGATIPDNIFKGNTSVTLGASVGVGIKFDKVKLVHNTNLECGYRFFYLGNSDLTKANGQVQNNLSTGNVYANSVLCTISA